MRLIHRQVELEPFAGGIVVPTMGALHRGHGKLIEEAVRLRAARGGQKAIVVTVFVNPTQFNDPKDLVRYPRTLGADVQLAAEAGADVVFAPEVGEVYPGGVHAAADTGGSDAIEGVRVATEPGLEDAFRPGHFTGVCQVVKRLFEMTKARTAMFGEKDWQQLQVVKMMTREKRLGVEIVGVETVREADGLAMSSRNVFLTQDERRRATVICRALCEAAGIAEWEHAEERMREMIEGEGLKVEYAVVRDAQTLMPLHAGAQRLTRKVDGQGKHPAVGRSLVAARLGSVRLIDNAPW